MSQKGVPPMEWIAPDFEEVETSAEVTAYVGHW
jgi:coenzyme PQQ precursor peptide PqqA